MFVFGKFRSLLKTNMFVIGTQRVNFLAGLFGTQKYGRVYRLMNGKANENWKADEELEIR